MGLRKVKTHEGRWTWSERKGKWFLDENVKLQLRRGRREKSSRKAGPADRQGRGERRKVTK